MVVKLYGDVRSSCTQRALTILKEKDVPFEYHHVDFAKGEQKSPEYLAKQPFGQLPYLVSNPSKNDFLVVLIAGLGRRWLHSLRESRDWFLYRFEICRSGHSRSHPH